MECNDRSSKKGWGDAAISLQKPASPSDDPVRGRRQRKERKIGFCFLHFFFFDVLGEGERKRGWDWHMFVSPPTGVRTVLLDDSAWVGYGFYFVELFFFFSFCGVDRRREKKGAKSW